MICSILSKSLGYFSLQRSQPGTSGTQRSQPRSGTAGSGLSALTEAESYQGTEVCTKHPKKYLSFAYSCLSCLLQILGVLVLFLFTFSFDLALRKLAHAIYDTYRDF